MKSFGTFDEANKTLVVPNSSDFQGTYKIMRSMSLLQWNQRIPITCFSLIIKKKTHFEVPFDALMYENLIHFMDSHFFVTN